MPVSNNALFHTKSLKADTVNISRYQGALIFLFCGEGDEVQSLRRAK